MDIKLTKQFQKKLELLLESQDYKIRFEKGNFKSGYCIIRNNKVIIINKYFTVEGKINALIEIIESLKISPNTCSKEHVITLNKILKNWELLF